MLFGLAFFASAHLSGASVEQVIDGYMVDIGYSPEIPLTDEQTRLDFAIYVPDTLEELPFTDIWVRITDDQNRLMFAGGLGKAEFGLTGLTFLFPQPGSYNVFTRFSNDGETLVEATAPLTIEAAKTGWPIGMNEVLAFLIGAALAALITFLLFRRTKSVPESVSSAPEPIPDLGHPFSYKNLLVTVAIGIVCSALAFYATMFLLDRGQEKPLSQRTAAPAQQPTLEGEVSIILTNRGFVPSEVTVRRGTMVTFSTDAGRPFWPASNLHPSHEIYPAFDPKRPLAPDESWSFTFDEVGEWGMHDHLRSYMTGDIKVIE